MFAVKKVLERWNSILFEEISIANQVDDDKISKTIGRLMEVLKRRL